MADAQLSAKERVFGTPELFELILSHLDVLEILRLQPVCHLFHSAINNSPVLLRQTFKRRQRNVHGSRPSFVAADMHARYTHIQRAMYPNQGPQPAPQSCVPHIDLRGFNPFLDRIFPGLQIKNLEYGWTLFRFDHFALLPQTSHTAPHRRPSWADMLLTASPLQRLHLRPATQLRKNSFSSFRPLIQPANWPNLPGNAASMVGSVPPPNPAEERRIAALYARMSRSLATAHRSGAHNYEQDRLRFLTGLEPGARASDEDLASPAPLPVSTALRWAAARGEASYEGWVWGSSLQFAGGKKPFPGYATSLAGGENGVTVGQLEEEMRGSKWTTWVIRQVVD